MQRLPVLIGIVAALTVGLIGAGSAFGGTISGPTDLYCSPYKSASQLCPRTTPVKLSKQVPAGVKSATVTWNGPNFCSDAHLLIFVDGANVGRTKPDNGPGKQKGDPYSNNGTATITLPSNGRPHTIAWQAQGTNGGCNSGTLVQFTGTVNVYFADPGFATIHGTVLDKDGQPVAGVEVRADGINGTLGTAIGSTDARGSYSLTVKAGSYQLTPSKSVTPPNAPTTKRALTFAPVNLARTVKSGDIGHADFTLQAGLKVTLTLSSPTVPNNGLTVVTATVATTESGLPLGDVTVSLRPNNSLSPTAAATTGARVTLCGSNATRVWPSGTIANPNGLPFDIVTNKDGVYTFTITVGTVPGSFELTAWARTASGALDTGPSAQTDATLTVTQQTPLALGTFTNALFAGRASLGSISNVPTEMAAQLALAAPGYAYAVGQGAQGGPALIVYPADNPPPITPSGEIHGNASGSDHLGDDLVLAPGEDDDPTAAARHRRGPVAQEQAPGNVLGYAQP